MTRAILPLILTLGLTACGTAMNPFNWFGNAREDEEPATETAETAEIADPRPLVAEILSVSIEDAAQGVIVLASARAPTQGFWRPELILAERGETALIYEFRALPPLQETRVGPAASRALVTGLQLDPSELAGIRSITVIGAENRRTTNR